MAFFGGNPFVNEYMGPAQQVAPAIPIMPVHPFAPALPPDCLATPAAKKARPACDDLIPRAEALALAEVAVQSAVAKKEAEMQKAFDDAMAKLADAQRERERDAAAHVAEVESLRSELASAREDAAAALTAAVVMEQEAKAASSEHAKAAKKDEHAKQLQKEVNYFKSMQAETAAELRRAERSADLQASRAALDRRDELEALSMEHTAAVKVTHMPYVSVIYISVVSTFRSRFERAGGLEATFILLLYSKKMESPLFIDVSIGSRARTPRGGVVAGGAG
jgi:hypothetical protein